MNVTVATHIYPCLALLQTVSPPSRESQRSPVWLPVQDDPSPEVITLEECTCSAQGTLWEGAANPEHPQKEDWDPSHSE